MFALVLLMWLSEVLCVQGLCDLCVVRRFGAAGGQPPLAPVEALSIEVG